MLTTNELAVQRTKLSNQRTYLAYMRTGFAISAIAGVFKKWWITLFGIIMILGSLLQYVIINNSLNHKTSLHHGFLDFIPVIYIILSIGALYLQQTKL